MDDGFQNRASARPIHFLCLMVLTELVTAIFPAGPMREHLRDGCHRADTAVVWTRS